MKLYWMLIAGGVAVGTLISSASIAQAQTLEFTSGDVGGGWYNLASGLSALVQEVEPSITLKTVPGGGVSNPSKLDRGISQIGFVQSIFGVAARNGEGPFDGKPHENLRLVLHGLADNYLHMIKAADDSATLKEILTSGNRNIGTANAGSTDEYSFRFFLDYYNSSYDQLRSSGKVVNAGYLDLASAFKDGQIDYIFVLLGLPGSMAVDAAQGRDVALTPFPDDLRGALSAKWGYAKKDIPASTYDGAGDQDIPVLVTSTSLYASADVPEETIYKIVQAICEAPQDRVKAIAAALSTFSCADAAGDGIVPLHPGTERYLAAHGYL